MRIYMSGDRDRQDPSREVPPPCVRGPLHRCLYLHSCLSTHGYMSIHETDMVATISRLLRIMSLFGRI